MIKLFLYFLLLILVFVNVVFDNHGWHFGRNGSMYGHCGSLFKLKPVASVVLRYHFVSIVGTFSYLPFPKEMKYSDGKIIERRGRLLDRSTVVGGYLGDC